MRPLAWIGLLFLSTAAFGGDLQHQGRDYLAGGETGKAVESFAAAVNVNPFDAVALNNLAVAKTAQGDYQTALVLLERASRLAPARQDISGNLARLRSWLDGKGDSPDVPGFSAAPPELPPLWSATGK